MFDFAASSIPLTISFGDDEAGMQELLDLMRDVGAVMEMETIATGSDIYRREIPEGVMPDVFGSLLRTKLLLKATTKKPKSEGYVEVSSYITSYLDMNTKMEYFVCKDAPGVGIVTETEEHKITPETVEDINKASVKLGGQNFAYNIDELGLMFEKARENHPLFKTKLLTAEELKEQYPDFDVIYANEQAAKVLHKAMKPKCGCSIFLGKDYAIFEPLPDYNYKGKGLLLAAAMMLKYAGQNDAAWAVYEKIAD